MNSSDLPSSKYRHAPSSERSSRPDGDVVRTIRGHAGVLSFTRPETANAIDEHVVVAMTEALREWREAREVDHVILDFAHPGGLTYSGTDLRFLAKCASWDFRQAVSFFAAQYRLIDMIRRYDKPVVAFLDGRLLGGAIGLAMAAGHRVVTPQTGFQFPETRVGLAPDSGSAWYLSRLRHRIGVWLVLTGTELTGSDLVWSGLATHIADAEQLETLKENVCNDGPGSLGPPHEVKSGFLESASEEIEHCFSHETVDGIIAALSAGSDWAKEQGKRIAKTCPLSAGVALRQLQTGAILSDHREALRLEYRVLSRLVCTRNFREGMRSVLLDPNTAPEWDPPSFSRVTSNRLAPLFSPPREGELQFADQPA